MEIRPAIIHYCNYQERCHTEVLHKLFSLGLDAQEAAIMIAELIEANLLNEERYARAIARGKFRMLQWGKDKIIQQLKFNKISDYCIKLALTEIEDIEYETTFNKLAEKKFLELKKEKSIPTKKNKLFRYLTQKGFERDLIQGYMKNTFDNNKN